MDTLIAYLKMKKEALVAAKAFLEGLDLQVVNDDSDGLLEPGTIIVEGRFSVEWDLVLDSESTISTSSQDEDDEDWGEDEEDEADSCEDKPLLIFSVGVFLWSPQGSQSPVASIFFRLGGHPSESAWRELKKIQRTVVGRMLLHGQDEFWETEDIIECSRIAIEGMTQAGLAEEVMNVVKKINEARQA